MPTEPLPGRGEVFAPAVLRKHDLGGRLGGEKLAACLINAPAHVRRTVVERISAKIADLLKRAGLALCEEKRSGRNQFMLVVSSLVLN